MMAARVSSIAAVPFPCKAQRKFANLDGKQEWIASVLLGISRSHVAGLQLGRKRPSIDLAILIWRKFKIPVRQWELDSVSPTETLTSSPSALARGTIGFGGSDDGK
jgi:DNA-binding XRE family transcriptional regulator